MLRKTPALILIILIIARCQSGNATLPTEKSPAIFPAPSMTATLPPSTATSMINPSIFYASPTATSTFTSPLAATLTFTPTPLPTSILNKRGLDIPIGDYYKFVIYKTKGGERLEEFAEKYNTSAEAILMINYRLTNPVWSDILFVIPVGFSNVEKLPIFVVYQIKGDDRGTSWDMLAALLRVNPVDLKYYNGVIAAGDRPLVGDLILVPWPRQAQKVRQDEAGK